MISWHPHSAIERVESSAKAEIFMHSISTRWKVQERVYRMYFIHNFLLSVKSAYLRQYDIVVLSSQIQKVVDVTTSWFSCINCFLTFEFSHMSQLIQEFVQFHEMLKFVVLLEVPQAIQPHLRLPETGMTNSQKDDFNKLSAFLKKLNEFVKSLQVDTCSKMRANQTRSRTNRTELDKVLHFQHLFKNL